MLYVYNVGGKLAMVPAMRKHLCVSVFFRDFSKVIADTDIVRSLKKRDFTWIDLVKTVR